MTRHCQKLLPSNSDKGSAALDFVLVSVPMLLMSLGVIATCLAAFILGVIRDSAVEGARFAALADQSAGSGCLRAQMLVDKLLAPAFPRQVNCGSIEVAGVNYESVKIQVGLPVIGVFKFTNLLTAESRAPREIQ